MTENATAHTHTAADSTTSAPVDTPAHSPADHGASYTPAPSGTDFGTAYSSAGHSSAYGPAGDSAYSPADYDASHGSTYGPGQPSTSAAASGSALSEAFGKATRLFRRSRTDRMLGGVCGGAATALGVDATLLRVGLVAATILGFGAGAVIYVVCWIVVPEAESDVHAA